MANENTRFIRAGRYGTKSTSYPRVTGNGTKSAPHNIETLDWQGNLVLAGGISCSGGGISCAGDIETSNGDLIATGDGVVGGRFDAGGGGSFGGNLGVTGNLSASGGTFTGRLDVGYGGIISNGDLYSRDIHITGDVRATGHLYDEDGLINVSKNYVNDIRIAKYYNVKLSEPYTVFGIANFTLFTQYEIPAIGADYLAGVCEALVRLGFYSNTPIEEDDIPTNNKVMPAFGYSRRGRSQVSKIVAGLYCSNYSPNNPDDNTLEVLCYDVVNSVYSTETWKSRLQQEPGFEEGSHTIAIVNAYQALEPVPEPEP